MACFAIFGIVENITVICMFCKCSSTFQTRTMKLLISLAVSDILMAIVGGPMFTSSSFNHSWLYDMTGRLIYDRKVIKYMQGEWLAFCEAVSTNLIKTVSSH